MSSKKKPVLVTIVSGKKKEAVVGETVAIAMKKLGWVPAEKPETNNKGN